jgi:hypothetical protein
MCIARKERQHRGEEYRYASIQVKRQMFNHSWGPPTSLPLILYASIARGEVRCLFRVGTQDADSSNLVGS